MKAIEDGCTERLPLFFLCTTKQEGHPDKHYITDNEGTVIATCITKAYAQLILELLEQGGRNEKEQGNG